MDLKTMLRKNMIKQLQSLSEKKREKIQKQQQHFLFQSKLWENSTIVGVTVSKGFEWDTKQIIEQGWQDEKIMAVPKCNPADKTMQYYELTSFDQLEIVYAGIEEPIPYVSKPIHAELLELCIVPGMVFDKTGYRIGFGGGYYDRLLPHLQTTTLSICSKMQIVSSVPNEGHDLPVDFLLTESGISDCKAFQA